MKKVIVNLAVSLDGFIEGPNGAVDWCIMDEEMQFDKFLDNVDTLFYGRLSYDAWGNFQPPTDAPDSEKQFWQDIHSKQKIVFSQQQRADVGARFIHKDIFDEVSKIKQSGGKDIWLYGGAQLVKTFIELNLIDVYQISVHPVVLGSGKPLFENIKERINLKLISSKAFSSGVLELCYAPLRS